MDLPVESDVVGKWQVESADHRLVIEIRFNKDSSYEQTAIRDGQRLDRKGSWEIDKSLLRIKGALIDMGGRWETEDVLWYFHPVRSSGRKPVLFGGVYGDPDTYHPATRLQQ
jgi:hypothetical protein